jgi:hypothetical protein
MITAQGKSFRSPPVNVGLYFPFAAPPPLCVSGAWVGRCMQTGRAAWLDPPGLMQEGVINGQVGKVVAPRGGAKTSLMKSVFGIRLASVQNGHIKVTKPNGEVIRVPKKSRVLVDDRKPNIQEITAGKPAEGEWAEYGRFVGATIVELASLPAINIFHADMGFKEQHLHKLAIKVGELVGRERLAPYEHFVLLIGVNTMYRNPEYRKAASVGTLERILNKLTLGSLKDYYKQRDRKYLAAHAKKFRYDPEFEGALRRLTAEDPDNPRNVERDEEKFIRTAAKLAILMGNAQEGQFGEVIGEEHSIFDIMHAQRAIWDWTGITPEARAILETVRQMAQELSLYRPDLDIMATIRLGDEERSAGDSIIHLQHRLEFVEKARAFEMFDVTTEQWTHGMATTLGAVGSVEHGIVDLINKGTAIRFYGPQPDDDDHLTRIGKESNFSDHQLHQLTGLSTGCWAVVAGDSRPVWVRHVLTPREWKIVETNNAVRRQMDRVPYSPEIMAPDTIRRMMAKGEAVQIGAE